MIVRRASVRFGEDPTTVAPGADSAVDVHVRPSTVATGIGVWVTAGVLTHLAIRCIDHMLDSRKKRE